MTAMNDLKQITDPAEIEPAIHQICAAGPVPREVLIAWLLGIRVRDIFETRIHQALEARGFLVERGTTIWKKK